MASVWSRLLRRATAAMRPSLVARGYTPLATRSTTTRYFWSYHHRRLRPPPNTQDRIWPCCRCYSTVSLFHHILPARVVGRIQVCEPALLPPRPSSSTRVWAGRGSRKSIAGMPGMAGMANIRPFHLGVVVLNPRALFSLLLQGRSHSIFPLSFHLHPQHNFGRAPRALFVPTALFHLVSPLSPSTSCLPKHPTPTGRPAEPSPSARDGRLEQPTVLPRLTLRLPRPLPAMPRRPMPEGASSRIRVGPCPGRPPKFRATRPGRRGRHRKGA
jgi:hypothetical protein